MKVQSWIKRLFLYSILALAISATYVVVTQLASPVSPLPEDEIVAFQRNLHRKASDIIAGRNQAIAEIGEAETLAVPQGIQPSAFTGRDSFINTQADVSSKLMNEIGVTTGHLSSGLSPSPALSDTLDQADELYIARNSDRTAILESIYYDLMHAQSQDYISYLGYHALLTTLRRDLIKYRSLESLPLYDIKLNIYTESANAASVQLETKKANADVEAASQVSELNTHYDELLAELVNKFSEKLASGDTDAAPSGPDSAVLNDIMARLHSLVQANPYMVSNVRYVSIPEFDCESWLSVESEFNEIFTANNTNGNN